METEVMYSNAFKLLPQKRICHYYNDPAHGWLKVPLKDIEKLDLIKYISKYSRWNGDFVYLEEDCDLGIYLNAMRAQGYKIGIKAHYVNRLSRIRDYKSFLHPTQPAQRITQNDDCYWRNVIDRFYKIAKQKVDLAIKFNVFEVYENDKVRYANGRDERDFKACFNMK